MTEIFKYQDTAGDMLAVDSDSNDSGLVFRASETESPGRATLSLWLSASRVHHLRNALDAWLRNHSSTEQVEGATIETGGGSWLIEHVTEVGEVTTSTRIEGPGEAPFNVGEVARQLVAQLMAATTTEQRDTANVRILAAALGCSPEGIVAGVETLVRQLRDESESAARLRREAREREAELQQALARLSTVAAERDDARAAIAAVKPESD